MKKSLLISVLLFISLLPVEAVKPNVTVIPFNSIGLSKSDAQSLTLFFETALQNTNTFVLIEQTEADNILQAQEYSLSDCLDEPCAIEIGRLLSADQIVLGTVGMVADLHYVTVKIIDVQTGQNLVAKKERDKSLSALVEKLDTIAQLLVGKVGATFAPDKVVVLDLPEGKYEGTIKDGKRNGQGTYYHANGERYEGRWADDSPVGGNTESFNGVRYLRKNCRVVKHPVPSDCLVAWGGVECSPGG